jgi:hypothetical protein
VLRCYSTKRSLAEAWPAIDAVRSARQSKLIVKQDRLIVKLVKQNADTHWFDLFKTKGIGGD